MISLGVVGCGYWGPNLVRNFTEIKDARVLMASDLRQERLDFIKKRFPWIDVTTDYDEMVNNKEIDAICIATHAASHFELAKKALENGKHLLIEKPMAMSAHEAWELYQMAKERNLVIMVGHILLYSGPVEYIREQISTGKVGDIFYMDSARVNLQPFRTDVNVLWDLAPHDISLAMFLMGKDPVSTIVFGESYVSESQENIAFGVLIFPGNVVSHFHLSWLAPMKMRQTTIVGSKKMIVYDDVDSINKIKIYDKGIDLASDPSGLTERQLILRRGDMYCPKVDEREPLYKEVQHFVDCVRTGQQPRSNGYEGYKVVKVVESMVKSMRSGGKEVEISFNTL